MGAVEKEMVKNQMLSRQIDEFAYQERIG